MTPYNADTNTLYVGESEEMNNRAMAAMFLNTFMKLATLENKGEPISPGIQGIKDDWDTIKRWVGAESDKLTQKQIEKWEITFVSYLAEGIAPSRDLEADFKEHALTAKKQDWKVMQLDDEIRGVCSRLLAGQSKASTPTKDKSLPVTQDFNFSKWWRSRPLNVRKWTFASAIWMILTSVIWGVFDPFSWSNHWGGPPAGEIIVVYGLPLWIWAIKAAYDKFVKL